MPSEGLILDSVIYSNTIWFGVTEFGMWPIFELLTDWGEGNVFTIPLPRQSKGLAWLVSRYLTYAPSAFAAGVLCMLYLMSYYVAGSPHSHSWSMTLLKPCPMGGVGWGVGWGGVGWGGVDVLHQCRGLKENNYNDCTSCSLTTFNIHLLNYACII